MFSTSIAACVKTTFVNANANTNRGIYFISQNIMHWFRSIATMCYFIKSIKSVFILVKCNTSLSKN